VLPGTSRFHRLGSATLLAIVATVVVAVAPPAATPILPTLRAFDAAPVRAANDDIDIGTTTRYVVVPDKALIRVTVNIVAVNQHPTQTSGGVITRFFYDGLNLGVQPEARHLRATQDGTSVQVTSAKVQGYRQVTVRFLANLYYGQTAHLRLTFDLPAGAPRSASDVRVGAAFASFLAWVFGDHGSVRIEVPAGFAVNVSGADVATETAPDGTQIITASTADPVHWYAWIDARNDDGLTRDRLSLADGEQIIVRGWPEDKRWRKLVTTILTEGVPDLVGLIGLPWPVNGPLNVLEIHTPLLEGYAGFYDPAHDEITISEDLDDLTIVHEASHAWFNSHLFTERWITEGLADEYASRVLAATGATKPAPGRVKPTAKVAFPLSQWPPPAPIADSQSGAREQYGYDAAWTVVRAIVKSAGPAGMRRVFKAAADGTTAYVGAGAPERTRLPNDWRRFLDLTEELGGATGVADLMATWVVPAGSQADLAARATARDAYHALVTAGEGWAPPTVVRMDLDRWAFDEAEPLMTEAQSILTQRDATAALATTLGLTAPGRLEQAYESATGASALDAAAELATATESSLEAVQAASRDASAPRDWLVSLGLSGKDPDGELVAARTAWESGDLHTATDQATLVSGTIAVAAEAGRGRAIVISSGVAIVLLLIALVALAYRQRRRQRARRLAAAASGIGSPAAGGAPSSPAPMAWPSPPASPPPPASPVEPPEPGPAGPSSVRPPPGPAP